MYTQHDNGKYFEYYLTKGRRIPTFLWHIESKPSLKYLNPIIWKISICVIYRPCKKQCVWQQKHRAHMQDTYRNLYIPWSNRAAFSHYALDSTSQLRQLAPEMHFFQWTYIPRVRNPVSILYKSTADRYRPVRVADGTITARCMFLKNASWEGSSIEINLKPTKLWWKNTLHNPKTWKCLQSWYWLRW